ncbi:substrate-binding domain-containing protein [Streptomyces sp. NPDC019937]|uniref:substrate-binding domain-containing protein n=1 Tax=Streptomyces sp. NPDC019937 TaxID=3154787 RepID=UPI0033EFD979
MCWRPGPTGRRGRGVCGCRRTCRWVGFDDTAIGAMPTPPLSTVRQPLAEMATEAVRLVDQERARPGTSTWQSAGWRRQR